MGLNLSNRQIALELDLHEIDAQTMTRQLRQGIVVRTPSVQLSDEVEGNEVYVVAGRKDNSEAVEKPVKDDATG